MAENNYHQLNPSTELDDLLEKKKGEVDSEKLDESVLVHNEKLKALGMMSAGLAHEINNPLNYAVLGVELLKQEGRNMLAPEYLRTLNDIEDGLIRIKNIVRDLKVFSRKDSASDNLSETFLVGELVASATRITAKHTEDIEIVITLNTPYRVVGDVSSIAQVIVNMINNSVDSIRERWKGIGGEITIYGIISGDRYKIEIIDNGVGIQADEIENMFTPFYTTKQATVGTGLGLSISQAIIKRHGSTINVESSVGQWTSMSFDLAIAD